MKISIIFPIKNQTDKFLENLEKKVIPFFNKCGFTYDVIVCPNGSSKEEQRKLELGLSKFPPFVKMLPYNEKGAKGLAVKNGILASCCDYDLIMDVDLATDLKAFDLIKENLNNYDAFLGDRDMKGAYSGKRPFIRELGHKISKEMVRLKFHFKEIGDTQCGFKLFKDDVAKEMVKRQTIDGIAYDVEHCYFLSLNKFRVKMIPVIWINDDANTSIPFAKSSKEFSSDLRRIKKNKKNYILSKEEREKYVNR
ncbi:MAG TPA: hypothetical protein DCR94_04035 [Firmicutes bacterium]|nr:hypothetical protein [Bacillota bacterium]